MAAVFWLQSSSTFPGRSDFVIFHTTRSGWALVISCASCWASARMSSAECRPGRAAYSCMPLLPLVTGTRGQPHRLEPRLDPQRHLRALAQAGAGPRVEVDDEPVGVEGVAVLVDLPLVHVQLQRGEVDQVGEVGQVQDERVGEPVAFGVRVGVAAVGRDRDAGQPAGAPEGRFFSKNIGPSTPCGQRMRVTARRPRRGSSTGATCA